MRRSWLLVVLLGLVGCSLGEGSGSSRSASPPLFNESAVTGTTTTAPGQRKKSLGEDCGSGRESACDSSLCLKTGLALGSGYYCSQACRDERDCPDAWTCQAVMPGPNGRVCVPPTNWTARATTVQP